MKKIYVLSLVFIVGAVVGFSTGIIWKDNSLEALPPVSNTYQSKEISVANTGDQSGEIGESIMKAFGEGLMDYVSQLGAGDNKAGIEKIISSNNDLTRQVSLKDRLSNVFTEKAQAQTTIPRGCSNIEIDWAKGKIKIGLTLDYFKPDDYCTFSKYLNGTWSIYLYQGTKPAGLSYIKFTFDGTIETVTYSKTSQGCQASPPVTAKITRTSYIEVMSDPNGQIFIDGIPSDASMICATIQSFDMRVENPYFSEEKCCGKKIAPTAPANTQTQSNSTN